MGLVCRARRDGDIIIKIGCHPSGRRLAVHMTVASGNRDVSCRPAGKALLAPGEGSGPRPLKLTGRHGHFLNSTCAIGLSDIRHGLKSIGKWDIAFSYIDM